MREFKKYKIKERKRGRQRERERDRERGWNFIKRRRAVESDGAKRLPTAV